MNSHAQAKKIRILEQLAVNTGAYYSFNLTQDRIPGIVWQVADGQRVNVNELAGLPENARLTDYLAFWGNRLAGREREAYFAFFSREHLLDCYRSRETHLVHSYRTETATLRPMIAEQHVILFDDDETGDILGVSYIIDRTETHRKEAYLRELKASNQTLETELDNDRRYLDVLSRKYILVYHLQLDTDSAKVLNLNSHANVRRFPCIYLGAQFRFSEHVRDFAARFIVEDSENFIRMLDLDYIARQLSTLSRYSFRYTGVPNQVGNRYFQVHVERFSPDRFDGQALIIAEEIDNLVVTEMQRQAELDTERRYLDVLTRDYTAVYHLNLHENTYTLIKSETSTMSHDMFSERIRTRYDYPARLRVFCEEFVAPEQRADFMRCMSSQNILQVLQRASRFLYRYHVLPRDDNRVFFEAQALPMSDSLESGNVLIAFRCIDDIVTAEQRRQIELEEQVRREQNKNETLRALGRNYHAIFQIDLPNDTYTEVACHDSIRHYYACSSLSARRMMEYVCNNYVAARHKEQMSRFFDLSTLVARMENREFIEVDCVSTEGNWHRVKFIVKRRDENGAAMQVLYVTQIIDSEKQYEEHLIAKAEYAEYANKSKTEFVSKVAHDIRTPMNSIFGFLEIAKANLDNRDKLLYSLERIRVAGEFLKELADDVLDISRMEHGKMKLQPAEIHLISMLEDFAQATQYAQRDKKLNLRFTFHDIVHDVIVADSLRLKQILANVLSNATKYTPDGGDVEFEVYQEPLAESGRVRLVSVITDTGIGMTQELLGRMFSSFERGTDTRINQVSGYGLGLTIVKQLVDLMDGTINVQSTPGEGTTFRITLDVPFAQDSAVPPPPAETPDSALCAGMHLLVAEDNELNREVITELLSIYGVSCDCVADGALCIERFRIAADRYDAILMDMQMPNLNGIEAAKKLRALPLAAAKTVPIIAMTANALKDDVRKCLEAGMNLHLTKPVDMKALTKALMEFKRAAQPEAARPEGGSRHDPA